MRAGDVLLVDFAIPVGSEPGRRPAVVVTADEVLRSRPRTIHMVPITTNVTRQLPTEIPVDTVGLDRQSLAQCHLCTVISTQRLVGERGLGNIGAASLAQLRAVLADLLDLWSGSG